MKTLKFILWTEFINFALLFKTIKTHILNQKANIQYQHANIMLNKWNRSSLLSVLLSTTSQSCYHCFSAARLYPFNSAVTRWLDCNKHVISWPRKEILTSGWTEKQTQVQSLSDYKQTPKNCSNTGTDLKTKIPSFCTSSRLLNFPQPSTVLSTRVTYLR